MERDVGDLKDGMDEYKINDTAYMRWSCHSGVANPVQIVSTPPARLPFFGQASHADPLEGWY